MPNYTRFTLPQTPEIVVVDYAVFNNAQTLGFMYMFASNVAGFIHNGDNLHI
ncbi:hypothetical protein ECDEC11C_4640 [Escherichia coli DEC11C]|nr:hypothetical protein ECDEC11C_4640 [Escherichia coli DEC11C]